MVVNLIVKGVCGGGHFFQVGGGRRSTRSQSQTAAAAAGIGSPNTVTASPTRGLNKIDYNCREKVERMKDFKKIVFSVYGR